MILKSVFISLVLLVSVNIAEMQTTASSQTDKQRTTVVVPTAEIGDEISLIEGRVVIVYDGDHISVQGRDGKIYSIRIQGIDAPEEEQAFGKKSRKKLSDLVVNKEVKVIVHKKDLYDRYVGSVYLNGIDVGLRQIEAGMAWHFKRFSGEQSADARARYARAELKARNQRDGLWSENAPVPPWEFREEQIAGSPDSDLDLNAPVPDKQQPKAADTASASTQPVSPSTPAQQSGQSGNRTYILGPRGGCYYINSSGSKVYVKDKSLCGKP